MKNPQSLESVVTLSNAAELVALIVQGVIGKDVADTFNGAPITRRVIYNQAMVRFQSAIAAKRKEL